MDVTEIQARVEQALEALGIKTIPIDPGRWLFLFGATATHPTLEMSAQVENEVILHLRCRPGLAHPTTQRSDLLEAVNTWHDHHRWPRLAVQAGTDHLTVVADTHVPLVGEVLVEQIAAHIDTFVMSCIEFWETFHRPAGEDELTAALAALLSSDQAPED